MAHVRKLANGKWQARYRGADGREHGKSFQRRIDADKFLAETVVNQGRSEWVDPAAGKVLVASYAKTWFEGKTVLAPQTVTNIRGRMNKWVLPYFGRMQVAAVTPGDVRRWVGGLVGEGLAASTVNATVRTAGQMFDGAVMDGLIARNPCNNVELPRERAHEEMHFLDVGQVQALADAITPRYRALVLTAAFTGMRAGELAALKVSSVNIPARIVEVKESMAEVGGKLEAGPTKTGKRRTVSLPEFLAEVLEAEVAGKARTDYVFTMAEGGPIRQRNFYRRHYKVAVIAAGLPATVRFHDLRHTCAALMIAAGRHIEEVKDRLGHSSIRVTSDRYGHLFPAARREVADALGAAWTRSARTVTEPGDLAKVNTAEIPRAAEKRPELAASDGGCQ